MSDVRYDFLGQEINIGDRVVSYNSGTYAGLVWGKVKKFTPKMITVAFERGRWTRETTRYGNDLIVMTEDQEQALAFSKMAGKA